MKRAWVLLLAVMAPVAARAVTDPAFTLFADGAYERAAGAAAAEQTAPGYALAARAVLSEASLREHPCLECLKRGEALARQAIAADPHNVQGQVWLAVAFAYEARIMGAVKARLAGIPRQSRAALDQALADAPDDPYALAALGGWHVEVVHGGGPFMAQLLYGASESQALALFDRALKKAPQDVALHYQVALLLADLGPDKYRDRIAVELKGAEAAVAQTAYERALQDRARELLGLMGEGAHDGFAARLRVYQGYP